MMIAFLGFGEAARAFRDSLAAHDPALRFVAYDILLDDAGAQGSMRQAMESRDVAVASDCAGLAEADWIISAVTADQSLNAIRSLAPHLVRGRLIIDVNSVSPGRKRESAMLVERAGCAYLDMAVMAPVQPRGHRTPVLLAGPAVDRVLAELDRLGFAYSVAGAEVGRATAIKMVRSLFVKGLEAITVETLLAARASGCLDEIVASLSTSYPGLDWPGFAAYQFERTLVHGKRRAAEMRESAATVADLGLAGRLADAIADVQDAMGRTGARPVDDDLAATIAATLSARRGSGR